MNELFYSNKIIRSLLWLLFLVVGCLIFLVQSAKAELANTNIVIKANIVANTCRVSPESMNKFVDLGVWGTKDLKQNKTTEPIKFTLNLTDCGVFTTGVKVTFKGDTDSQDNTLFKIVRK
ncbi:hypothetical protein BHE89_17660 [Shigella sp. FC1967]|uniref:fimbrial protein n=1 Tax=Shigella sp. FC1967 TaxID=1898041 RepID=UPI00086A2528|nr:hypothetical protein [Shigella sp. FC1967]OEJ07276.1 hypothetical protein BHE89_17660 [Shigella sp. FC1967]